MVGVLVGRGVAEGGLVGGSFGVRVLVAVRVPVRVLVPVWVRVPVLVGVSVFDGVSVVVGVSVIVGVFVFSAVLVTVAVSVVVGTGGWVGGTTPQPYSALPTAWMIRAMSTTLCAFSSCGHAESGRFPSAMLTSMINSFTVTAASSLQFPTQAA
jgi:hypothetical protein